MEETGWWVYDLYSLKVILYVGMSQNPDHRLKEHNEARVKYTKGHLPWELFYKEYVGERKEARTKEKCYKVSSGKQKLKKMLEK